MNESYLFHNSGARPYQDNQTKYWHLDLGFTTLTSRLINPKRAIQNLYDQFWIIRRDEVFSRDEQCVLCGSKSNLSVDHIKSRAHGGCDNIENLRLLCNFCHSARHGINVKS